MEQEFNIVLVTDKKDPDKKLKGIKGIDKEGILETSTLENAIDPRQFARFDKSLNPITLVKNFWSILKNPTNYLFYSVPENQFENFKNAPGDVLKKFEANDQVKSLVKVLVPMFDESKINWKALEKWGITKDDLVQNKSLPDMLKGNGSKELMNVHVEIDGVKFDGQARVFLNQNDNEIGFKLKSKIDRPNLSNFHGEKFTKEDYGNLNKTGNLGRVAMLMLGDKVEPCFVSLDRLTNRPVFMRVASLKRKDTHRGAPITDEAWASLLTGRAVFLTGMKQKDGTLVDGYVQVNAEYKGIAGVRSRQQQQNMQQKYVPKKFRDQTLSDMQHEILSTGGTIILYNLNCSDGKNRDVFYKQNAKGVVKLYDANEPANRKLFEEVIRCEAAYKQKHNITDDSQNTQKETSKKGRKI